jgi:hypothetical protein
VINEALKHTMKRSFPGHFSDENSVQAIHDVLTGKDEDRAVEMFCRMRAGANGSMDDMYLTSDLDGVCPPMGASG